MNIWTYLVVIAFVGVGWAGFSRPFYGPGSCGGMPLFNVTFEPVLGGGIFMVV